MNKNFLASLVVLGTLFVAQGASAGILANVKEASCNNPSNCNVNGIDLIGSATTNVPDHAAADVKFVGAGIRLHTFIIKVQVYLTQLLVTDPSKFVRTSAGALASLDNEKTAVLQLHFKFGVGASDVQKAFQDALSINTDKYDMKSAEIQKFLDAVRNSGDAQNGHTMAIVGEKLADGEYITYESTQGSATTIKGGAGFVKAIFSIWLGNTSDDADLTNTKNDILKDRGVLPAAN